MKPVLHFRIPLDQDGMPIFSVEVGQRILSNIHNIIGDDYYVIGSPMLMETTDGENLTFEIDNKIYNMDEIREIVWQYKDLCR